MGILWGGGVLRRLFVWTSRGWGPMAEGAVEETCSRV